MVPASLLEKGSICYCAGCGEDISFDLGLIEEFGCQIYAFDPTPRAIQYVSAVVGKNPDYHFFDVGLWNQEDELKFYSPKNPDHVSYSLINLQKTEDCIVVKVRRLKNIVDELGHSGLDLLKLDIEGAEYKVIESIIDDDLDIKTICVEYDECSNPLDADFRTRIRESVQSLCGKGYVLVHISGSGNYTFVKNEV